MSDYPEWQATARLAYEVQKMNEEAEKAAEDKKTNASHAYVLKSLLNTAGIEAEPTNGTWEKDGYTFSLYFDFHLFLDVTHMDMKQDGLVINTGVTTNTAWAIARDQAFLDVADNFKINVGKVLYEIDQLRQKQAKTDVHVVAAEPAVRVMSPLEERLLDSLRVFVVNAVSEIDEYDEDRPY